MTDPHDEFLRTPPPHDLLGTIVRELGLGTARATGIRRLEGGISSAVHRVDFDDGTAVVIRRFDRNLDWHSDDVVRHEVAVLDALAPTAIPAPKLLFADVTGARTGCPLLVLSLLPGESVVPSADERWLTRLAEGLARIHDCDIDVAAPRWVDAEWQGADPPRSLETAPMADEVWTAITAVRAELESTERAFAHLDYHPGNTLWSGGRLTGIADWPSAGRAYVGYDATYTAMDLALCVGPDAAATFLDAYERITTRTLHPGWRAVVARRALPELADWLPGYLGAGVDLTLAQLEERATAWVHDAVARL